MRQFQGRHGEIYSVGSPYKFRDLPLEDCGGGFDWRVRDRSLSFWLSGLQPEFGVCVDGLWTDVQPVEVYPRMGKVGFGRCLEGREVRASGVCLPLALLAETSSWEVQIEIVIKQGMVVGGGGRVATAEPSDSTALLHGVEIDAQEVVARLWPTSAGAFVGFGYAHTQFDQMVLTYDDEGVLYEPY